MVTLRGLTCRALALRMSLEYPFDPRQFLQVAKICISIAGRIA
jgi:hypothetical protein